MKEILNQVCELYGISQSALSNKLGKSRGFVQSMKSKKNDNILKRLLAVYPDLNPYYLLTGQGPMLIDMKGSTKIAAMGRENAEYKILYENLMTMYDDVIKSNRHMEQVNRNLLKQNNSLLDRFNSLSNND